MTGEPDPVSAAIFAFTDAKVVLNLQPIRDAVLEQVADELRSRFPVTIPSGVDFAEGWLDAADYIDPRVDTVTGESWRNRE